MAALPETSRRPEIHQDDKNKPPKKRLVVCCDGTWMDADQSVQTPSNVTRFVRAINPMGIDHSTGLPIAQVAYYHDGVGTGHEGWYNEYIGGATGEGMSLNIREAYSFICDNYYPGDEIFIIGFSRGAFTARSISSLIHQLGLLTPYGLRFLIQIFDDWEYQLKAGWQTKYPNEPWKNRPRFNDPEYQKKLIELQLTRPNIPIKCVAVWDTVGALGIPRIALLPQPASTDYAFVNTEVAENIEYAFHALALDERRRSYAPTIWEQPDKSRGPKVLKQTWFPGVHSDIGGSYDDDDMANITLAWMCGQLDQYKLLTFDVDYIFQLVRLSIDRHALEVARTQDPTILDTDPGKLMKKNASEPLRAWGLGLIHDSMTLFFRLGGIKNRTPGENYRTDLETLKLTKQRLQNTNEHMHACVRVRIGRNNLGFNDHGKYNPQSLHGWKMSGTDSDPQTPIERSLPGQPGKMKNVVWKKTVHESNHEAELVIPEDELTDIERQVLRRWTHAHDDWQKTADKREAEVDSARPADRQV